jgi:enolase-phosphatase E1
MIKFILTDIEGTTTAISFVADTLFPYFLEHIDELKAQLKDPFVQEQLQVAKATVLEEENKSISDEEAIEYLAKWCREDRKHPALKSLQGMIWKAGYLNGQLKGHLYPEVEGVLRQWKADGIELGIYSSGSVPAQKLLFGYSEAGDLTPLFSTYFDTKVGHKREVASYQNIQKELNIPANEILFLSDVEPELDAARKAGFCTCKLIRPGTGPSSKHMTVETFEEIELNSFS